MPRRCPVPSVVTVHDLSFFDEPRVARAIQGRPLPTGHRAGGAGRRRGRLPEPGYGRGPADAGARWTPRWSWPPTASTPSGSGPTSPHPGADAACLAAVDARLASGRPLLVFVGTLEPRKDVPTLVRAFSAVAGRHPDALLVLAGGPGLGRRRGRGRRDAVGSGPDGSCGPGTWRTTAIPALLRSATAVVYPSLYEGFGLPALEALACGARLVTTTRDGHGGGGGTSALLVPPGDVGALGEVLDSVLGGRPGRPGGVRAPDRGLRHRRRATPGRRSADLHVGAYRTAVDSGADERSLGGCAQPVGCPSCAP